MNKKVLTFIFVLCMFSQNYAKANPVQSFNHLAFESKQGVTQIANVSNNPKLKLKDLSPKIDIGKIKYMYLGFKMKETIENLNLEGEDSNELAMTYMNILLTLDWEKVNNFYAQLIKKHPNCYQLYMLRASFNAGFILSNSEYENTKKSAKLIKSDCDKVIKLVPKNAEAYCFRGVITLGLNMLGEYNLSAYSRAANDFDKAIELNPKYKEAYTSRGALKYNLEDYSGAITDFSKAISIDNKYQEAYLCRAGVYASQKKYRNAINDYNKAIDIDKKYKDAYLARGIVKHKIKKYKEAINDFNKAIELAPNDANIYNKRGVSKYASEHYKDAFSDFAKMSEINPKNYIAYNNMGAILCLMSDYKGAIDDYTIAIEMNNEYATAYYNRGLLKYIVAKTKEDYASAFSDYEQAIEILTRENSNTSLKRASVIAKELLKLKNN